MKNGRTLKQCEKIAKEMIDSMYFNAFIHHAEIVIYIYNVKGKICTQTFKKGVILLTYEDIINKKVYQIEKLCESYFYNSPFGETLHTPEVEDLAKKIYNYQKKVGVKNDI